MKNIFKSGNLSLFSLFLIISVFVFSACNQSDNPNSSSNDNNFGKSSSIQGEFPQKPLVVLDAPNPGSVWGVTITVNVPENFYGKLFIQESYDGGETWTTLAKTDDNDCLNSFSAFLEFSAGTHLLRGHYAPSNCEGTKSCANSSEPEEILITTGED